MARPRDTVRKIVASRREPFAFSNAGRSGGLIAQMDLLTTTTLQARLAEPHNLLNQVGNTPLLRLQHISTAIPDGVEIYAKAEWHNPSGSVKDRPAAGIIRSALESGALTPNHTLLDATSGNMGIAYATLAASLGLQVQLTLPANASRSRIEILRTLGAEITLTDPLENTDGARVVAAQLAADHPDRFYFADQYANPANWQEHYRTTGPEVLEGTRGRLTHFVAGLGTTGTLMGTGRFLREQLPGVRLVGVQPDGPLHGLEGLKHLESSVVPAIFDPNVPDEMISVSTDNTYKMARRLAREKGVIVDISAAAAAVASIRLTQGIDRDVIVTVFPDSDMKYIDEPFWSES